mgnify:CR=1 FL=1
MAGAAAQLAGAGLVTVALPERLNVVAETFRSSIMSLPLPGTEIGRLGRRATEAVLGQSEKMDVCALGPGLGRDEATQQMVRDLLGELSCPVVVDADGLNALAGDPTVLSERVAPTVLTPHPGEMKRLRWLSSTVEVQRDREGVAVECAREYDSVVVLKGHRTVVTDGERIYVNPTGNPGMATGGMGDVLTGLIAGLYCQGLGLYGAAQLGVFVHGLAGDLASKHVGELSLSPEDLLGTIPRALKDGG